jgi:hypothetical protein
MRYGCSCLLVLPLGDLCTPMIALKCDVDQCITRGSESSTLFCALAPSRCIHSIHVSTRSFYLPSALQSVIALLLTDVWLNTVNQLAGLGLAAALYKLTYPPAFSSSTSLHGAQTST